MSIARLSAPGASPEPQYIWTNHLLFESIAGDSVGGVIGSSAKFSAGMAGYRGKQLGKTHIGELFVKERVLKLPSPWPQRFRLAISERRLRLLITSLIVLFLLMMGGTLLMQLTQSRVAHIAEQNQLSTI
ncbi:MAG: hypothetical protein ACKOED_13080, partial [Aestuariivirga sp.]|uniref:hypothetical protein n=1 Tax=Aestuariivirga sp. TaxID=2650926 RepID=UPI0038CF48F3